MDASAHSSFTPWICCDTVYKDMQCNATGYYDYDDYDDTVHTTHERRRPLRRTHALELLGFVFVRHLAALVCSLACRMTSRWMISRGGGSGCRIWKMDLEFYADFSAVGHYSAQTCLKNMSARKNKVPKPVPALSVSRFTVRAVCREPFSNSVEEIPERRLKQKKVYACPGSSDETVPSVLLLRALSETSGAVAGSIQGHRVSDSCRRGERTDGLERA
ncbi:hypothetical protein HPB51_014696 [Rhipicephalus microplus]|uniref:Uncharacterized protein n=1 Tax=Rhipicephalus microplus TaxID=6941 RepID=A0A9J6DMT3_RHIMP|nr:hypothetical protein HPB51_014696 [Rhipicephalus microplus]